MATDGATAVRDYGKVSPTFWTGETGIKLRNAGRDAQLLALYLISGPNANMIGLYHLPMVLIGHHLGLSREGASKALQRVIQSGFAFYDEASEVVFVVEMAAHQIGDYLKPKDKRHKRVCKDLENWRKSAFHKHFYARYELPFQLPKLSPIEGASKFGSQEQEQEQEQNTKGDAPADGTSMAFQMAWSTYPAGKRTGKPIAAQSWQDAVSALESRHDSRREAEDWLLRRVKDFAKSPLAKSKFSKSISNWLNGGHYDDPPEAWDRDDPPEPTGPPPVATPPAIPARIAKANFTKDPYATESQT